MDQEELEEREYIAKRNAELNAQDAEKDRIKIDSKASIRCSFCGLSVGDVSVEFMIIGDGVPAICGSCVELCRDVIGAARESARNNVEGEM
jgi:hypothetical protein